MITLAAVLALDPVQAAAPLLRTTSTDPSSIPVRWVHSSEVLDVASLLRGGELLLTAGSILLRLPLEEQRGYLERLAARRIAAVAIETAGEPRPLAAALVAHADALALPVIELRATAPFVAIAERVNREALARRAASHELVDGLSSRMARHLAEHGPQLDPLLAMIARTLEVETVLTGRDGSVLGRAGPAGGAAVTPLPTTAGEDGSARASAPVIVGSQLVAELVLRSPDPAREDLAIAAERLSSIMSLALLGTPHHGPQQLADQQLLAAVIDGASAAATARAWDRAHLPREQAAAVAVLRPAGAPPDIGSVSAALRRAGCAVRSQQEGDALVLLVTSAGPGPLDRRRIVGTMGEAAAGRAARGVLGPTVRGPLHLRTSCVEAHEVLRLARPSAGTVIDALDHLDLRLFSELDDPAFLDVAVEDCLGAIQDWDRRHGTELLRSLDVWLDTGCSATRAASLLHIERQTMHKRIAKALELLGRDPRAEGSLFSVHAAVRAGRTRPIRT